MQRAAFTHRAASTHTHIYKQKLLHREAFTHGHFYAQKLFHIEACTQGSLCREKLSHTEAFTQNSFYTQRLLHTDTFTRRSFDTGKPLQRAAFTQSSFYTQMLLHTETFTRRAASTHRGFCTEQPLHIDAFTHRNFFTGKPLQRAAFTHIRFYTQTLLHTDAFAQRSLYTGTLLHTEQLLHTDAFAQRSLYTRTLLHTDAFTQGSLCREQLSHTEALAHRRFYSKSKNFHLEQPVGSSMISTDEFRPIEQQTNRVCFDMCAFGLKLPKTSKFIRKRSQLWTTSDVMLRQLANHDCPGNHVHTQIAGSMHHDGKTIPVSSFCATYCHGFAETCAKLLCEDHSNMCQTSFVHEDEPLVKRVRFNPESFKRRRVNSSVPAAATGDQPNAPVDGTIVASESL